MRRILLSLLILIPSMLSAISIVQSGGMELDAAVLERMEAAVERSGDGIVPSSVESLALTDAWEDENALHVVVEGYHLAFDRSRLIASIDEEVEAFLIYPVFLTPVEGDRLDFIYTPSYSTYSLENAGEGRIYDLVDAEGRATARFIASRVEESGLVHLDPIYLRSAHAGLALEEKPSWKLSISFSQIFSPAWKGVGSIRVKNTSWLYPVNPSLGVEAGLDDWGNFYFAAMLGGEYALHFGGLVDSSFTLLEDGGLYAGMDLALGWNGSILWGSGWRIGYMHYLSRNFSWSAGVDYTILRAVGGSANALRQLRLSLGMGVMF